jgi:hypothetical protein
MKNLMAKLKGMDYKQFALEHGEKIGFILIVLFVAGGLFDTQWFGYDKLPSQLEEEASKSAAGLQASTWPDDKRQQFTTSTYWQKAQAMFSPVAAERFGYVGPISFPLYPLEEPIKEAEYLPVERLVAYSGRAILAKRPAGSLPDSAMPSEVPATAEDPSDLRDREFVRRDNAAAAGTAGGAVVPGGVGRGDMTMANPAVMAGRGRGPASPGMAPGMTMPGMPGMTEGGTQSWAEGEGKRFISVVGTFNMRVQIDKYAKAMHLENFSDAAEMIEFLDFRIERQRAVAGPTPWTGPWESVNVELALETLADSEDFDIDPVNPDVFNDVFTMPLPKRLFGEWGFRVTHPDLKSYELATREEMEREQALNQLALDEYGNMEGGGLTQKPKKGGFSPQQINIREVRNEVFSRRSPDELMRERMANSSSARGMGADPAMMMMRGMGGAQFQTRLASSGRVLLFRYIDFDVEPGEAYRYRVQLILQNPNSHRSIEEVVDQSVITGEERATPWSAPSTPATVEEDVEVFLVAADRAARSPKSGAELEVFQWDPKYGTYIASKLHNLYGEVIGGLAKTLRLDVSKPSLKEEEKVKFSTQDILVDTAAARQVLLAEHPDLKISPKTKTRPEEIGIADVAVVVNRFGELIELDNVTAGKDKSRIQEYVERERAPFKDLENKDETGGSDLDRLSQSMMMQQAMSANGSAGKGKTAPGAGGRQGGSPIRRPMGGGNSRTSAGAGASRGP